MNLTGFIEFLLLVTVNKSAYRGIVEKVYREQEYLIDIPLNTSELIIVAFFCLQLIRQALGENGCSSLDPCFSCIIQPSHAHKARIKDRILVGGHSSSPNW